MNNTEKRSKFTKYQFQKFENYKPIKYIQMLANGIDIAPSNNSLVIIGFWMVIHVSFINQRLSKASIKFSMILSGLFARLAVSIHRLKTRFQFRGTLRLRAQYKEMRIAQTCWKGLGLESRKIKLAAMFESTTIEFTKFKTSTVQEKSD